MVEQTGTSATEHFTWARDRAIEYVEMGDGGAAMASLISDLNRHPGTAHIMTPDLQVLMLGEVMLAGPRGARRFIEGIPAPVGAS